MYKIKKNSLIQKASKTFFDKKFLAYLLAGLVAFSLEFGVFNMLDIAFEANLLVANTLSFLMGLLISYSLNEYVVFKKSEFTMTGIARKGSYAILAGVNLIITNVLIWVFVGFGINNSIAKLMVMAFIIFWNFLIFSKLIFKSKTN